MPTAQKPSKADEAYQRIRQLYDRGDFEGEQKLTESGLADRLELGRGPVRESLLKLEAEGVIRFRGIRRGRVIEFTEDVDQHELLHRYEVRQRIEGAAAGLCAKNLTGWQIEQLYKLAEKVTRLSRVENKEENYLATQRFIDFMLEYCGNPMLREIWDTYRLRGPMTRSDELLKQIVEHMPDPARETPSVLDVTEAIARHEAADAERLASLRIQHIADAIRQVHWARSTEKEELEE